MGIEGSNSLIPCVSHPRSVLCKIKTASIFQIWVVKRTDGSGRVRRQVVGNQIVKALSTVLAQAAAVILFWHSWIV